MPHIRVKPQLCLQRPSFDRAIAAYLLVTLGITAYLGWQNMAARDPWVIGDWLINYAGGFVRRGLMGELLLLAGDAGHIRTESLAYAVQLLAYAAYMGFSYLLIRKTDGASYLLLIFSPFIFYFQINDPILGLRKECLLFALLAANCWSVLYQSQRGNYRVLYASLLLYPALILSHEMLAVYLPLLLLAQKTAIVRSTGHMTATASLVAINVAAFALAAAFRGDIGQMQAICGSLQDFCPDDRSAENIANLGAIGALATDSAFATGLVIDKRLHSLVGLWHYLQSTLLIGVAFIPIRARLRMLIADKFCLLLLASSVAGTCLLMTVAIDWGRFITIIAIALFLLSFCFDPDRTARASPAAAATAGSVTVSLRYALICAVYFVSWQVR